jgi:glyoxylase-like metal-dependent hydrolase (beta-lactamase superfamily II)
MLELFPDVFYIPGANNAAFPYSSGLYLAGRDRRVLIDVGMGPAALAPVKARGVDLIILSHTHLDHHLTKSELPGVPIWCHQAEAGYMSDLDAFLRATGMDQSDFDPFAGGKFPRAIFEAPIGRALRGDERLDLGGLTLQLIHAPGHTPGHLAFFVPEHDLLFSADVDLIPFGPFYGHEFADIEDFLISIERLKNMGARVVATGHSGPFTDDLPRRFDDYAAAIPRREQLVLDSLDRPRSLDDFHRKNLIYPHYPEPTVLIQWFELVHIKKHLARLADRGQVVEENGRWRRVQ